MKTIHRYIFTALLAGLGVAGAIYYFSLQDKPDKPTVKPFTSLEVCVSEKTSDGADLQRAQTDCEQIFNNLRGDL